MIHIGEKDKSITLYRNDGGYIEQLVFGEDATDDAKLRALKNAFNSEHLKVRNYEEGVKELIYLLQCVRDKKEAQELLVKRGLEICLYLIDGLYHGGERKDEEYIKSAYEDVRK